jgi:hypothetical protein
MPLVPAPGERPVFHRGLRAVGFFMHSEGAVPPETVRVLVTFEALADLTDTKIADELKAREQLDDVRTSLETAASRRFDSMKSAPLYDGWPTILLTSGDRLKID